MTRWLRHLTWSPWDLAKAKSASCRLVASSGAGSNKEWSGSIWFTTHFGLKAHSCVISSMEKNILPYICLDRSLLHLELGSSHDFIFHCTRVSIPDTWLHNAAMDKMERCRKKLPNFFFYISLILSTSTYNFSNGNVNGLLLSELMFRTFFFFFVKVENICFRAEQQS